MNLLAKVLLIFVSVSIAFAALASPPNCDDQKEPPGKSKKPSKVTILHCGCPDEGDLMHYVEIQVSSKSKGHAKHEMGSIDSCSDGSDSFRDFVRTASDCQVDDGSDLMEEWAWCGDRMAMDECGQIGGDG